MTKFDKYSEILNFNTQLKPNDLEKLFKIIPPEFDNYLRPIISPALEILESVIILKENSFQPNLELLDSHYFIKKINSSYTANWFDTNSLEFSSTENILSFIQGAALNPVEFRRKITAANKSEAFEEALKQAELSGLSKYENRILQLFEISSRYQSPFSDKLFTMFSNAIKSGLLSNEKRMYKALLEITSQVLMDAFIRTKSPEVKATIKSDYQSFAIADSFHFSRKDPKTQEAFNDVIGLYRRGLMYRQSFSALKYPSKRDYDQENWELVEFSKDCGHAVSIINSSSAAEYPGKGFKLSGLNIDTLFARGTDSEDPFKLYKEAWGKLADHLVPTSQTDYYFLRGCLVVSSPNDASHNIRVDIAGRQAHYSLLIVNDHFAGSNPVLTGEESFYLVPTEIIRTIFNDTEIDISDHSGFDKNRKDINGRELSISGIYEEAEKLGLPVLNLGTGSNFAGGLTNAWLPGTKWFFPNEMALKSKKSVMSDAWGHTHKGDISGDYLSEMTPLTQMLLQPFAEPHEQLSDVANSLFSRLDILFIGHAAWTKGLNIDNTANLTIENNTDTEPSGQDDDFWRGDEHQATESDLFADEATSSDDDSWWRGDDNLEYTSDNSDNDTWWRGDNQSQDGIGISDNQASQGFQGETFALREDATYSDLYSNPKIYRALESAYKWHFSGRRNGIFNPNDYPVYALGSDTNMGSITPSPFYLDTHNMTLKVGTTVLQLPISEGSLPEEAMEIWRELVVPHFLKNVAIRPYDRRDLHFYRGDVSHD